MCIDTRSDDDDKQVEAPSFPLHSAQGRSGRVEVHTAHQHTHTHTHTHVLLDTHSCFSHPHAQDIQRPDFSRCVQVDRGHNGHQGMFWQTNIWPVEFSITDRTGVTW